MVGEYLTVDAPFISVDRELPADRAPLAWVSGGQVRGQTQEYAQAADQKKKGRRGKKNANKNSTTPLCSIEDLDLDLDTEFPVGTNRDITSLEDCEHVLKDAEAIIPFLPAELITEYQPMIQEARTLLETTKRTHERRINEATNVDAKESYRSINLFYDYYDMGDFESMKTVGDKLNVSLLALIDLTIGYIREKKLLQALSVLGQSYPHWIAYVNTIYKWEQNPRAYSKWLVKHVGLMFRGRLEFNVSPAICAMTKLHVSLAAEIDRLIMSFTYQNKLLSATECQFDGIAAYLDQGNEDIQRSLSIRNNSLMKRSWGAILHIGKEFREVSDSFSSQLEDLDNMLVEAGDSGTEVNTCDISSRIECLMQLVTLVKEKSTLLHKVTAHCEPYAECCLISDKTAMKDLNLKACTYEEMKKKMLTAIGNFDVMARLSLLHNKALRTPNASDRNCFYRRIQVAMSILIVWDRNEAVMVGRVNRRDYENACRNHLVDQIDRIGVEAEKKIISSDYDELSMLLDNLRSINENLSDDIIKDKAAGFMRTIGLSFMKRIDTMKEQAWLTDAEWNSVPFDEGLYSKVAKELITMKTVATQMVLYKKRIDEEYIDVLLMDLKARHTGASGTHFFQGFSGFLGGLRTSDAPVASQILAGHPAFYGHKLLLRNEKVLRCTLEDMLSGITCEGEQDSSPRPLDETTKGHLLAFSELFEEEYWSLVEMGLQQKDSLPAVLASVVENTRRTATGKNLNRSERIARLMAFVFSFWTLRASQHYLEASAPTGAGTGEEAGDAQSVRKNKSLLQPHSGQIIGILRMLGVGNPARGITQNHVVEIGTGEGKSVTLAVSAIILALLGSEVDVVCYSEYLSDRDYESFQSMFSSFGLSHMIRYGTFRTLCEKFLNGRGNIREGVSSVMSLSHEGEKNVSKFLATEQKSRILLIDEVDVFFNKDFYANIYQPFAKLNGQEITDFVKMLWNKYSTEKSSLRVSLIMKEPLYIRCRDRFKGWEFFFDESVKMLLADLATFEGPSHAYHVDSKKSRIGYKDHDNIIYNITAGYKTMFAYFKEFDNGKITTSSLEKNIFLLVDCGAFSYAAIPSMYKHILGVSGTLKELSKGEKDVLRNVYNIKRASYLPSVYGTNKLAFDSNNPRTIKINNSAQFYNEIVTELKLQLQGKPKDRAVLVFFETKKKVDHFLESVAMRALRGQVRVMKEEDTVADREQAVRQAVTSKSFTVLSRDFGRGTDFICFDDELDASGGVHVIQTFVSLEVSEEKQIRGRAARQGNMGSYSLILLDTELEAIGISQDMITDFEARGERYTVIDRMRKMTFDTSYSAAMTYVDGIKKNHEDSQAFLQALYKKDLGAIKEFIRARNIGPALQEEGVLSRTICLMDATGSMSALIDKSKMAVQNMFERAITILKDLGYPQGFEMQFVVYRNYNAGPSALLQHSAWEQKPDQLRTSMSGIGADYGMGNEAVEIGLWHVNREIEAGTVTQVILIGDMPPNTRTEVTYKRGDQNQWRGSDYATPTYYKDELEDIIEAGVPVHTFYVDDCARNVFETIAKQTGGETGPLDVESDRGAEMLTTLVTIRILENVNKSVGGGAAKEKELKDAYYSKYGFI